MRNITLISTMHDAVGECNSITLSKILLSIIPDVLFIEMPPSLFSKDYLERSEKLEMDAIKIYSEQFKAEIVPVDIDDIPSGDLFSEYQNAMEGVLRLTDINGETLRMLFSTKKRNAAIYGFNFLNSEDYVLFNEKITKAIKKALEKINDKKLSFAYQEWNKLADRREKEMLQRIYKYSNSHNYSKAVFLLGASHRKSIKEKIETYCLDELPKLNWAIYGDSTDY